MSKASVVVYRVLVVVLLAVIAGGQVLQLRRLGGTVDVNVQGGILEVINARLPHNDGEWHAVPLFVTKENPSFSTKRRRRTSDFA